MSYHELYANFSKKKDQFLPNYFSFKSTAEKIKAQLFQNIHKLNVQKNFQWPNGTCY